MKACSFVAVGALVSACGGSVGTSSAPGDAAPPRDAGEDRVAIDSGVLDAPVDVAPPPVDILETTLTRDGRKLDLTMCHKRLDASGAAAAPKLEIYGEVFDSTFEVDEAVVAFTVSPATASGTISCRPGVAPSVDVAFAEARGAEFQADPNVCKFVLIDNGQVSGVAKGTVDAEYNAISSAGTPVRHRFVVNFAAPRCSQ